MVTEAYLPLGNMQPAKEASLGFGGGEGKGGGGVQAGFAAQRLIQRLLSTVVYLSCQHLF